MTGGDLSGLSMMGLFRLEMESQLQVLTDGMLALEQDPGSAEQIEALMRAVHSIKGAARMVGVDAVVRISHVMEDCFVSAQKEELVLNSEIIDVLLDGVDMIRQVTEEREEPINEWLARHEAEIDPLIASISSALVRRSVDMPDTPVTEVPEPTEPAVDRINEHDTERAAQQVQNTLEDVQKEFSKEIEALCETGINEKQHLDWSNDELARNKGRVLRVSSEHMDHLLGLAGEAMVESRWLRPFLETMLRHKRYQFELVRDLDSLRELIGDLDITHDTENLMTEMQRKANDYREFISDRLNDLESYDHRSTNLASRLHREVIASRMRPFSDGTEGMQRMVRDVARSLKKKVKLEINGLSTQVDRDVLEMLKAPLSHLLRNAIDHGIEMPEERLKAEKPEQGTIRLEAYHRAGMLSVNVTDDGKGVDMSKLSEKIIAKGLTTEEMVDQMSESELLDFLFLPSFSTRDFVTEISGRGVGLDVVADSIREIRGIVTASTTPGKGMRFHMQLPLTLSVARTLLVEIGGECYAFPLARIDHLLKLPRDEVKSLEEREYMTWNGQHIGLTVAAQIFGVEQIQDQDDNLLIIVISDRHSQYGVIVDRFLGERELAVQVLDPRLGKVKDISAAAMLDDGSPSLIIDVDDLVRSIDKLVSHGQLNKLNLDTQLMGEKERQKILVVDDSITVREVQRNLLETYGFDVDVAVDGMDGWNTVRSNEYDLVITDVDMPRMDGIALVENIKKDPQLKGLQVMIVSYKDRPEDRQRGLSAGADYYLTKGSFHDESLRDAVIDLIGEA